MREPKIKIEKLKRYRPQRANANKHTERGIGMLDQSMSEDGYVAPMTAAADGEIIDGSARLERAYERFGDDAIVVHHDGTKPIVMVRTDIKSADTPEAKRIALRANRIAQVDLDWSPEILAQLKDEGVTDSVFTEKELAALLPQGESKDAEPQIDRAAELQQKWGTETGQVWQIGRHRLLVGDSTNEADVGRLCVEKCVLVSDPPYGINADTSWLSALHVQRGKPSNKSDLKLVGDDGALDLSWAFAWSQWLMFGFPYIGRQEPYTGLLVWDKRGDGGEGGLGNPVEVAVSNTFNGYRLKRHVWAGFVREKGEKREPHMTQKPVGIMIDAIELVKGDIFDPFVGSGTTLVAAENLNRTCYAIEICPAYVAVCLERMKTAFPHLEIKREEIACAA